MGFSGGMPTGRLVGLLVEKTGHFIRFHLQALNHDVLLAGDRLDVEMIRQCLEALDEKTQQPLEFDTHRATNAAPGNPFHKQAFDECTPFIRDEVLLEALDKLASTVVAVMVLFAIMNVTIFLVPG
jgi:hypothetical protein